MTRIYLALVLLAVSWGTRCSCQEIPIEAQQTGKYPVFPYYPCANKIASAYRFAPTVTYVGSGTYCFTIQVDNCTSKCCNVDIRKIEIDIYDSCIFQPLPAITATINGTATRIGPAFGRPVEAANGSAVLYLTQLGLDKTSAAGARVCITLRANRLGKGCTTLTQLCKPPPGMPVGVCQLAIFDSQSQCCPLSNAAEPGPPSPLPPSPTPPPPPSPSPELASPPPSPSPEPPSSPPPPSPEPPSSPPPSPSPNPPSPPPPSPDPSPPPTDSPSPPPSPAPSVPPSPPPSTPAPSPLPSCAACIYVKLTPPAIDVNPYRFTPPKCAEYQFLMASQLNDQAASPASGIAPLLQNFTGDPSLCSGLQAGVCGVLSSAADGQALAAWANAQAALWLSAVSGATTCTAGLDGYGVTVTSNGDTCVPVQRAVSCAPSKAVVNPFPKCGCNLTKATTPFKAAPYGYTEQGRKATTTNYCFVIYLLGPDEIVPNKCGVTDRLLKVEFWADDNKNRAISGIYLRPNTGSAVWLAPVWGSKGENALRATPMNWTMSQANGAKICLELANTVSITDFCAGPAPNQCYISFFNGKRSCCPLYRSEVLF